MFAAPDVGWGRGRVQRCTYASSLAGADIVRQTSHVKWVTHEDCCLDLAHSCGAELDSCIGDALVRVPAAAESSVKDFAPLRQTTSQLYHGSVLMM